jgi:hypothetical protein
MARTYARIAAKSRASASPVSFIVRIDQARLWRSAGTSTSKKTP